MEDYNKKMAAIYNDPGYGYSAWGATSATAYVTPTISFNVDQVAGTVDTLHVGNWDPNSYQYVVKEEPKKGPETPMEWLHRRCDEMIAVAHAPAY